MKMRKRRIVVLLFAVLVVVGIGVWYVFCGGVSHRTLKAAIVREGAGTRAHVDRRCDALERKLDRIERKLDRLLEMATPRLPDGMRPAE